MQSSAKTHVIYASYKYVVGDNDTKNDAKRICFIEAKRRCLEKAGTYIESQTVVKSYKLTSDEIRAYAAAIIKVEIVSELVEFQNETLIIYMTVRAEVEEEELKKKIREIRSDRALQRKVREQERQLDQLERKIRDLQKKTFLANVPGVSEIRKERKKTFDDLDRWEKLRRQTVANKRQKNIRAFRSVRENMTACLTSIIFSLRRQIKFPFP
jgi:polyhydroxyalkanoate synthesis regulator phasin